MSLLESRDTASLSFGHSESVLADCSTESNIDFDTMTFRLLLLHMLLDLLKRCRLRRDIEFSISQTVNSLTLIDGHRQIS